MTGCRIPGRVMLAALLVTAPARCGAEPASGPLRVSKANPRYFADATGRTVYLTGSHTWPNLIDRGPADPPAAFDYDAYLDLLKTHRHNFVRLWTRHVSKYVFYSGDNQPLYSQPLAWPRTGPGMALDGKPKFDLDRLDRAYFDRLRERVVAAGERGIYVAIMLFGGYSECKEWQGSPFNAANNVNGIDGDPDADGGGFETHNLELIPPALFKVEEAYVRKVIDTVNDLDNVLYEISNESMQDSWKWQYHWIDYIRAYEGMKPKQHPVGMTAFFDVNDNPKLWASPADWISPGPASPFWDDRREPYIVDPAEADGSKVVLLDSDHLFFRLMINEPALATAWAWKSFCRGHNPILMENLFVDSSGSRVPVTLDDPGFSAARRAMGHTAGYASKIDLAAATPQDGLSSTRYCLASEGAQYLVYQPADGPFDVTLAAGTYVVEWFDPATGEATAGGTITAETGKRDFTPPFTGPAVLYLNGDPDQE
ncbi:MAG: DUF6298 domain-containing protein [Pirellulales bacterium]